MEKGIASRHAPPLAAIGRCKGALQLVDWRVDEWVVIVGGGHVEQSQGWSPRELKKNLMRIKW